MYTLMIHCFSRSEQQHMQTPIPEARFLSRQLHQSRAQLIIAACGLITATRYRYPQKPANPALARRVLPSQPVRIRPLVYELHPFFAMTAFSISLSRLRSTTGFFNFVFSSRNCFASCASFTSIPPYFAFHAYRVCFDTPTSRATSSTLRPASNCFSAPIICASVCLLFDILFPFPSTKSYSISCGFRGAGQNVDGKKIGRASCRERV